MGELTNFERIGLFKSLASKDTRAASDLLVTMLTRSHPSPNDRLLEIEFLRAVDDIAHSYDGAIYAYPRRFEEQLKRIHERTVRMAVRQVWKNIGKHEQPYSLIV